MSRGEVSAVIAAGIKQATEGGESATRSKISSTCWDSCEFVQSSLPEDTFLR